MEHWNYCWIWLKFNVEPSEKTSKNKNLYILPSYEKSFNAKLNYYAEIKVIKTSAIVEIQNLLNITAKKISEIEKVTNSIKEKPHLR